MVVMVIDERPLKKLKCRQTSDMLDILTFPREEDEYLGAFRENVKGFLGKHGKGGGIELFQKVLIWQILFRIDGRDDDLVALDVLEEDVARSKSLYCDQCRVIGWSGHPVCRKRYHFIIRRNTSSIGGHQKFCPDCANLLHFSHPRCRSCNYMDPHYDVEKWVNLQLEDTSHLLHGIVHSNGYGHLLRVNGKEGGSEVLSGCDIMGFWDRLCKALGVRKISVMDVSKKFGLEYRVLHAVTNGHPWYGNWGYEFGTGCFALDRDAYQKAVNNLSLVPLSLFLQSRAPRTRLQDVITFYQSLSDCHLTTTRDLFCFLMELTQNVDEQHQVVGNSKSGPSSWLCTWTKDHIDRVELSMVKVLRAVGGNRWVPWRALKGAVQGVGSTELVDYCLKELRGKSVDGTVIISRCNPELDAIEYRLASNGSSSETAAYNSTVVNSNWRPTKEYVLRDMKFLYDALLNPQTMQIYKPKTTEKAVSSATKLLDCKQFVKVYRANNAAVNPFTLQISCVVELTDTPDDYTAPPPELVTLPLNATKADFMTEASKAFQDMYLLFEKFQVDELLGYKEEYSSSQLKYLVGHTAAVRLQGRLCEVEGLEHFRMERGTECWIVDCPCGAKDDDGERMLACDECSIWFHTRCAGINDSDPVPEKFVCWRCMSLKKKSGCSTTKQFGAICTKSAKCTKILQKVSARKGMSKVSSKQPKTLGKGITKKGSSKISSKHSRNGGRIKINNVDGIYFTKDKPKSNSLLAVKEEDIVTFSSKEFSAKHSERGNDENSCPNPAGFCEKSGSLTGEEKHILASSDSSTIGSAGYGNETIAVVDTCSSEKAFIKLSDSLWKCKDEPVDVLDARRMGSSLTVPFSVR